MAYDEDHGVGRTENVGGVYVDIYDDGHVDIQEERLLRRIKHKIDMTIGQTIAGCVFSVVFVLLFASILVGAGVYIWANIDMPISTSAPRAHQNAPVTWDGSVPLTCDGNDKMEVRDVAAILPGQPAVVATANCKLTIHGSTIEGTPAIEASGNAKITINGGSLKGKPNAIESRSNARVVLNGVSISGAKKATSLSKIEGS